MDVVRNFLARYEQTREEEMSLEEYLEACKRDPLAYATAAERMLAAIGEPEDGRHPARPAPVAHLRQQGDPDLPGVQGFLRHGGADRAGRLLLPPRGAGPGGEKADPLPAGPGRRRQVVDRRAAEAADGAGALLRDQGLAGERVAAGPVQQRRRRAAARAAVRHPAALPAAHHVALGREAARGIRRRHPQVPGRQALPVDPEAVRASPRPSRATRTTRTSRRWSARSTSASSKPMRRTTRTPTAIPAACAWPTRACSSSSRCSRRRSRCCIRC